MTELDRMLAERACERLIIDYCALNDAGEWAALAALYTVDGRMNRPTAPTDFVSGQAAILASLQARPKRHARHICANIRVTVVDADHATAVSQILLFTATAAPGDGLPVQSPQPPLVGSYHDQLVRTAHGWRFVERCGSLDFVQ